MAEYETPRTRLEQLLRQQHVTLEEFRKNYQRAAEGTTLSERQAYRWVAGELRGLPYPQALAASPALVHDPARHVSVVDPATVLEQGGRYVFVRPDAEGLAWLAERAADGRITVEIQQVFDLAAAPDAHRLLEEGHVRGKLVLRL